MINKSGHKGLGMKLKDLIEKRDDAIENLKDIEPTPRPDTKTKDGKKDFIVEILEAWKEARTYDDLHLFDDHTNWLRFHFNNGSFEFPDDYDFDTNVWTIGKLIAQVERYGGVVLDTDNGTLPYTPVPTNVPEFKKHSINEETDGG